MQETFMKSSLYAICAGHKLRPARRVYSGFQNKIKTICIYDTPLSVSCFSWNRNWKVFTDFPEISQINLPSPNTFSPVSLFTEMTSANYADIIISAAIQTRSCDTDIGNKKTTRHFSPHGSCTPFPIHVRPVSTWLQLNNEISRQQIGSFVHSQQSCHFWTVLRTYVHLFMCRVKAAKFILSDIDKNTHQCWLDSVSLLVPRVMCH